MSENNSMQTTKRKWTWMVYLAGDNNLESFGSKDLGEMKAVGSTIDVNVIAEFDKMSDQVTRRYALTQGGNLNQDCVMEIPEINTGDPRALIDFCIWAIQTYPAQHYALILWNHGSGWKDDDIYRLTRRVDGSQAIARGQVRGLTSGKSRRSLFFTSLEKLVAEVSQTPRAILFDDSSADFLDNQELRRVLHTIKIRSGSRIDLLGFDACLMNMVEVDYQLRGYCSVAVASQETEPGDGWPYDSILESLTQEPDMNAHALGRVIVEKYLNFYQSSDPDLSVTQSAVDLLKIKDLARAVGDLGSILAMKLKDPVSNRIVLGIIFRALRSAQTFSDRDYVDLLHFCHLISEEDGTNQYGFGLSAKKVTTLFAGPNSPVISSGQHGSETLNANGISIYLPGRTLSPLYKRLDFSRYYRWDEFLQVFIG